MQSKQKIAYCMVPVSDQRPGREVTSALARLGFSVQSNTIPSRVGPDDVVVTWTAWEGSSRKIVVDMAKRSGAKVIHIENAWLPHPALPKMFQVQLNGYNGLGQFPDGGPARWKSWRLPIDPWRKAEAAAPTILVAPQRGLAKPNDKTIAHTPEWATSICEKLMERFPGFAIKFRPHPGNPSLRPAVQGVEMLSSTVPLQEQIFEGEQPIFGVVVYSSAVSALATLAGIPVFYDGPSVQIKEVCFNDIDTFASGQTPRGRGKVFSKSAWAQWTKEEIASGEPFARLLADV